MTKRVHMWATAMVAMLLGAGTPGGVFVVSAAEDDLAGIVTSGNGPEAGVWVVAEGDQRRKCRPAREGSLLDAEAIARDAKGCSRARPSASLL